MFHTHSWVEVRRSFSPPAFSFKSESINEDSLRRLTSGFTTVELKCKECGDLKSTEMFGDLTEKK